MATLNFNTSAKAGTTVEVWSQKAIMDRRESNIFEYLKDYTNAIIRQDDAGLRNMYPSPNEGYTMTYMNEARLKGKGKANQATLAGNEEKRVRASFNYAAGFRRNAVANDQYVPNIDINEATYMQKEREDLAEWMGYDKQFQDMSRMISESNTLLKTFGNGSVSDYASITSSHILDDDTFIALKQSLTRYNASPVWFSQDMENPSGKFRGYVALVDETVAEAMLGSDDYSTFVETFFEGWGYESPLAQISYGKKNNLAIIPVEPQKGFGSPLRPELIIGADGDEIADDGNDDATVGLPEYNSSSGAFDDYTNDTSGVIEFTKYLSDFLTASGTTSSGVSAKIIKYTGEVVTGITVKLGSTNTDYTVNILNESGGAYTPQAGDRIVILGSLVMAIGADAYISHQSAPYFTGQSEDYDFERGMAINYWEGGTTVKDSQKIANKIALNFVYAA